MRSFIKNTLVFMIPIVVLFCLYFIMDPFRVVWNYDNYYCNGEIALNKNFVSTMNYLNKKDTYHYDSFIIGNSRSFYYRIDDWKKYIPAESNCYHFSEYGGSVHGLRYKLRLIDSLNQKINNALIILDCEILDRIELHAIESMMPPALINNKNWLKFQQRYLFEWYNPQYIYFWIKLKYKWPHDVSMRSYEVIIDNLKYYNPITNEEYNHHDDSLIVRGIFYNQKKLKGFEGAQHPGISEELLNDEEKIRSFIEIKDILAKHRTNYKIVISPLYNQIKINPKDLEFLQTLFGSKNVYDFSGVNKYTSDYHNYYESSHYRPEVASEIMNYIYNH